MPLMPYSAFEPVFAPLRGKRIGYVRLPGNVGDGLIEMATGQLLQHFDVTAEWFDFAHPVPVDELIIAGGGNMGPLYPQCERERQRARDVGVPTTILPQSFTGPETCVYHRIFVRERSSLAVCPQATLAPELTLGLDVRCAARLTRPVGLWLRNDVEGRFDGIPNEGDPILICKTPMEYLALAARFGHVITDRLHFAIASLLCGRQATLLPNGYHKNRSMYETWLADLGCGWAETPAAALAALRR